ncbi:MAG: helix-turn-helix domain-containing protein, partial [Actinomycetales bacterium]|nr:helix-turn-helix domain-containing protein [Actinomycetales bacterium]
MPGARLTVHDREVIERGVRAGWSAGRIAEAIGKHRTTVVRELARGSGARNARRARSPMPGR